jgi:predicted RNase H-like HicB family nuclease
MRGEQGMLSYPQGVVEKEGDCYVGHCHEVGTVSYGRTVEEAFANLREVTWQYLERQQVGGTRDHQRDNRLAA